MTESIEDKKYRIDSQKVLEIHSLAEFLFPDRTILIDCVDDVIKFEIKKK